MDNYPTSYLTVSELVVEVKADPQATTRERDLAERLEAMIRQSARIPIASLNVSTLGRGDRG